MELNKYLFPLRKWWWLVLASTLLAATFSYLDIQRKPTIYQASTTLMIGTTITDPNPAYNEIVLSQQLAVAYAEIANRELVRDGAMHALNLSQLPKYIARAVPNTQLIQINVTDSNPERAQMVANELAAQLILQSPSSTQLEDQSRQDFINERLNSLEVQIKDTEAEIENLQEELGSMISSQQIDDTQTQISSLESKLSSMQDNYGVLLSNTQQGAINTLTVIEPAAIPSPVGPKRTLTVLLAAALGFALAVCQAYLLDYLDDTLKSAEEVKRLFSAPIIGHIFEHKDEIDKKQLYDTANLQHPIVDAFRNLRTKLEFSEVDRPLKTILVSSPDVGDGKTSVAANLAQSIAQKEKKVVLLDADLRRPNIDKYFNLTNDLGLVDVFLGRATINDVFRFEGINKLAVITAGNVPPNPTELLGSKKMEQILSMLEKVSDVVIIDGPPLFVADAMILASKVDGVLLVVRPGHTRRSLAKLSMEQISQAGARLVGVVLNRIPLRGADYYAGKSYLYTYYLNNYGSEDNNKEGKKDPEKSKASLSPFANKVTGYFEHLFKDVFKIST